MFKSLKSVLFSCALLVVCGSTLKAATTYNLTIFANLAGRQFSLANGTVIPFGDSVLLGTFNTSGANLTTLQTSNSYSAVNALFTPLGEGISLAGTEAGLGVTTTSNTNIPNVLTTTGTGVGLIVNNQGTAPDNTGSTQGTINTIDVSYMPTGTLLYAWVFNTTFANRSNATEWGIFTTSDTSWNTPAAGTSKNLVTSNAALIAVRGTIAGTSGAGGQAQLAGVPEPSTYALLGTGLLTAAAMLRRRKKA
jgi:hypothetical protein